MDVREKLVSQNSAGIRKAGQSVGGKIKNMKITIDSREKKCDHIKSWFEKNGIEYKIRKLDEGDYQIEGQPKITVDRKKDMQEMYNCVVNDKSRFYKEVRRCHQKGIKLYVLIEHGGQIKSLADVPKWKPKYGTISSREISERLYRLHISYGVEILFCDKRCTARRILEILTKEYLQDMETDNTHTKGEDD